MFESARRNVSLGLQQSLNFLAQTLKWHIYTGQVVGSLSSTLKTKAGQKCLT